MGGFCGVVSKDDCIGDLFFGTDYHSHLGTHRGGLAVLGDQGFQRSIHNIQNAPFRSKFENDFGRFSGKVGIGVISDTDPQPLVMTSRLGRIAIATVGLISNIKELMDELFRDYASQLQYSTTSGMVGPTEVVSALLATRSSIVEGVRYVQERVKGSCSILVVDEKGHLYAARDRYGRTPIVIGRKASGYIALMESCALPNLGYEYVRDLGPGEMVEMTADGLTTVIEPGKKMAICSFLWVYYGFPASSYEGRNVEMARYRCGGALARRYPVDVDAACGIPDSGTSHALGYAHEAGIKYARPFVKYTPTWARGIVVWPFATIRLCAAPSWASRRTDFIRKGARRSMFGLPARRFFILADSSISPGRRVSTISLRAATFAGMRARGRISRSMWIRMERPIRVWWTTSARN